MVLRARDKQITFCARCIAILDAAYNLSEEIAYYAQLEGESDE